MTTTIIPELGPETSLPLPEPYRAELDNGLRVAVYPFRDTGLVDVRLRFNAAYANIAAADLLTATFLSGTDEWSQAELAARLQSLGATVGVSSSSDHLTLNASVLSEYTTKLFEILAHVFTGATYPDREFGTERARMVDSITVAEREPSYVVGKLLHKRLWDGHPYGYQEPTSAEVSDVAADEVRRLHDERLRPGAAELTVVTAADPSEVVRQLNAVFSDWSGNNDTDTIAPLPPWKTGPIVLGDRDNAVQSAIRVATPTVGRTHPDNAAMQLANLIYGGYFSSRLTANLREDKGYGYSPRSSIQHRPAGSVQLSVVDVATEVTAAALEETYAELDGMSSNPPSQEELDQARQYALGNLKLALAGQSGLIGYASNLAANGLSLDWLKGHTERLQRVTVDDIVRVSAERLNSRRAVTVVSGDVAAISGELRALGSVEEV
ncbi:M16 family metallopeptidase [Haloglycomyces albus]|uniref:M16 family metallopeptidase n=1 Tax=Haloglycomyces albus TaxID=526067 RepID=UPI00046CBA7F|nr:pitrilysin family protein [Haloglycomyces albus]